MKSDLESIAVFVSVMNHGSFSAAARALGLTPSAISKRIASLESDLGVSLIRRTTRRISLTEAGKEFFERCSQSLTAITAAEESLSRFTNSPHGLLRIKAPQAFGRLHIAPAIPKFMERHPQIQIDLDLRPSTQDFIEEQIDILVASSPPRDSDLVARKLAPFERVTCAARSYVKRCGRPDSVNDLTHHNCLMFSGSDSMGNEWTLHGENGRQRIKVSGSFRTNDAESLYLAVMQGAGIAHMPTFVVGPDLASGRLIPIFRDKRSASSACMTAFFPRAKYRLPKVRAFVDHLIDSLRNKDWSGEIEPGCKPRKRRQASSR